ncbi:activated RNA polymerase II transcriptional coactivator p15-like [Hydractinia symbiolongicarpus]|uniref:activated RNA polymerase II transcriptional coactivator p15-like n=1 Tax=Hydractinia symbiolongicarpus TaxID=13093 RepID=UPI00254ADC4A|nr:activated RNA polymerase II transcriptional coactivator p15-like [Hydractinia symbiolongicarpus]
MSKRVKSKEFISDDSDSDVEQSKKKNKKEKTAKKEDNASHGDDDASSWDLGKKKKVSISEFKGQTYINIREYYEADGELKPGRKGIALNLSQWDELTKVVDKINKKIKK